MRSPRRNGRGRDSDRPAHRYEEWPPLSATGESPRTETKTQRSQKKKSTMLTSYYFYYHFYGLGIIESLLGSSDKHLLIESNYTYSKIKQQSSSLSSCNTQG